MRSLLGALFALLLLLTACSGDDSADNANSEPETASSETTDAVADEPETTTTTSSTTTSTTTTTEPPPPFEYLERGEYPVGVTTLTIDEDTDRPLTVDVWFPLADDVTGDPAEYTLLPGTYYTSPNAISAEFSSVVTDAQFPFVVYSHGSGGQRWIHSDYTEFLASHGYIVAAADHTGNTLLERFSGADLDIEALAFQRPNDVASVIDAFYPPDGTTPIADALGGVLTDDVIVTGHSFGGFTSYAMVSGVETANGTFEPDDRVTAVITLAPAAGAQLLPDELLATIDVPHLVMAGDSDDTTPINPNVERPWELVPGRPSYRVELVAGEHETFTDLCNYNDQLPELESVPDLVVDALATFTASTCAPTAMQLDRAQPITNTFAVRFLDEVTQGAPALADDNVVYDDDLRFLIK